LVIVFGLCSCTAYRLERALEPDIREWYDLHRILMDAKVPEWIETPEVAERMHFLRLPAEVQRMYIAAFWKIRKAGANDLFYCRIVEADYLFRDEGRRGYMTDRGRVYLIHGPPAFIQYYDKHGDYMLGDSSGVLSVRQAWMYRVGGYAAMYVFHRSVGVVWRQEYSIHMDNRYFEQEAMRVFHPTRAGWELWADILYQYQRSDG
jgi:GWxTD domain-containing protein